MNHPIPLTSLQRELWLSHLGLPDEHPGISCGGLFELTGVPDVGLIRTALGVLVRHFPLLSATLRQSGDIFPTIEPWVWLEPDFSYQDLSDEPNPDQAAQKWLRNFVERPFSPMGGQLCRFALLRLGAYKSLFVNRFFHIAGDGIVCITHFNVMARIYTDLLSGGPVSLGATPDWLEDVRQDQDHLASARAESDKDFWREHVAALPTEPIFLPKLGRLDRIDTISRLEYDLPDSMTTQLRCCAAANKAGISDVLMALHLLTLARLYDRDRLTMQVPIRFGERRDQWGFHGHRVNVVPLWVEIGAESIFATLLADIQRQMRALLRRNRTPFQLAFRDSDEHPELSRIWDTNFNFISMPADGDLGGVQARRVTPTTSRFEPVVLGVYAVQATEDKGLHLSIDYSLNHFSEEDARHYLARLELLLAEVTAHPQALLNRVSPLLPQEHASLKSWQDGIPCHFEEGSLPALFERVATTYGEQQAVSAAEDSRTYRAVSTRSDGIAAWLTASGIKPGEVVAVLTRRHPALAETILGIMKAGAVYLPVDPEYPQERISHMLTDSAARKILALGKEDADTLPDLFMAEYLPEPEALPHSRPPTTISMEDAAYLIYTSGSTGVPKGVLVSHRGFVNMIQAQIRFLGITSADHVLQFASPSFDASLSEIFMALLAGARLYPVSRTLIDEPWVLRDFMAKHRVSVVTFPPSYLRLFNGASFPGLRVLITAGETPLSNDARHYAAELEYINAYGPTEASVCATMIRLTPPTLGQPGLIGRPIPNTSAYILDSKGCMVAPGIRGELCLAGPGLAIGYLGREELTATRFISACFNPELRLYRTGDLAAWTRDGEITLLGRLDEQVKIRGHRIELGEIERALVEHPDITQAVALALPLNALSLDLIAFLVGEGRTAIKSAQLRDWLRPRLPDYMVPARFRWIPTLPIAPTGKVDRRQLACLARQEDEQTKEDAPPPASILEEEVRTIFATVLGEPVSSLEADFFSLGGDSIRVMELGRRLTERFGQTFSTQQLLADSSVAGVAARLPKKPVPPLLPSEETTPCLVEATPSAPR